MWAKFKLIDAVDYTQGDLIRENSADETGIIWSRQYDVSLGDGTLPRLVKLMSGELGACKQCIVELPLEEDQGNIHEPPNTRALTNLDIDPCVIDFYYEDLEADVYFAKEGLVRIHQTDFNLNWSVILMPNETILIDATLPTRINFGRKVLWRDWEREFKHVKARFSPWLGIDAVQKEQEIIQKLTSRGVDTSSPVIVKIDGRVMYTKTPPTIVLAN
jgi:hypothetical protein